MRITGESNKGQCGCVYGTVKGMNGGLVMDNEVFMSVPLVLIDVVAQMAKDARGKGAAEVLAGESVEEPLVKKFWESLKGVGTEEREEKKAHKVVHLLKNQPPLPSKVVEKIKEGSFVDFAFFPVFDDGPGEAGDWRASQGESGESTAAGSAGRRRSVKEVPDFRVGHLLHSVPSGVGEQQARDVGSTVRLQRGDSKVGEETPVDPSGSLRQAVQAGGGGESRDELGGREPVVAAGHRPRHTAGKA